MWMTLSSVCGYFSQLFTLLVVHESTFNARTYCFHTTNSTRRHDKDGKILTARVSTYSVLLVDDKYKCSARHNFYCLNSCCSSKFSCHSVSSENALHMILHPVTKPLSQAAAPRITAAASSSSIDLLFQLRGGAKAIASNAPFDLDLAKTRLEGENSN